MEEVLLSVIVPVYNTARDLPGCLDSLLRQSRGDIEFICVDDGSTDDGPAILAEYAKRDTRIRVITQENRGFAGARNRGMAEAKGRYIGFCDSDDWVEPAMYDRLLETAIAGDYPDIVQCSFVSEYVSCGVSLPKIPDILPVC